MGLLTVIGQTIKAILFFLDLFRERDKKRAASKAVVAKEVVDAFTETDKETRASKLSAAVVNINKLRK